MSAFEFFCQYCGQRLAAERKDAGRKVECPVCQSRFPIPDPPKESAGAQSHAAVAADVDENGDEPPPDWSASGRQHSVTAGAGAAVENAEQPVAPPLEARMTQPGVIEFACPFCTQSLSATPEDVGQEAVCPVCDTAMHVPALGEVALPSDAGGFAEPLAEDSDSSGSSMTTTSESSWETVPLSDSSLDLGGTTAVGDMFGGADFGETTSDFDEQPFGDEPVEVPVESLESEVEEVPVAPHAAEEDVPELVDLAEPAPVADEAAASAGASVPVLKAFKPPAQSDSGVGRLNEEILTDGAASVIRVEAMKQVQSVLARSRATCGIIEPEFDVKPVVAPRFYAFTRSSPTGTKNLWVLIFFRLHLIAYHPESHTEVICRSPDFSLEVTFRPGGQEAQATTLFALRLQLLGKAAKQARRPKNDDDEPVNVAQGETVESYEVCKVKLSMRANGGAAQSAQEVALKLKGWIREHPVLSKQVEKRLKKRKSSPARPAPGPAKGAPKAVPPSPRTAPQQRRAGGTRTTKTTRTTRGKDSSGTTKRTDTGGSERTKPKAPQRSATRRLKKRR